MIVLDPPATAAPTPIPIFAPLLRVDTWLVVFWLDVGVGDGWIEVAAVVGDDTVELGDGDVELVGSDVELVGGDVELVDAIKSHMLAMLVFELRLDFLAALTS
jgi:hypothetical protein